MHPYSEALVIILNIVKETQNKESCSYLENTLFHLEDLTDKSTCTFKSHLNNPKTFDFL